MFDLMRTKPSNTVITAWARLMRAQQIALEAIEQALKSAGLPQLSWYDALLELERVGEQGLRPFELEREMLMAQYNLSRLIDRIEKAGYAERHNCESDGRGQVIVITEPGKEMRRQMWAVYRPAIQSAIGAHLSPKAVKTLDRLLGTLIEKSTVQ
jgi:DNA-binding MarR family transcriptional regulator